MDIIYIFRVVIKAFFLVLITVLFCLAVKNCFWNGKKSKIKLFLLSFLTSPVLIYIETLIIPEVVGKIFFNEILDHNIETGTYSESELLYLIISTPVTYVLLIFLFAWISWKCLGISEKKQILFLYLMFNTIMTIAFRGPGKASDTLDIIGVLFLYIAVCLFYHYDVRNLSETKNIKVSINWTGFIIPPVIFIYLYNNFTMLMYYKADYFDVKMMITIYGFSTTIVFLYIWAFNVIIKNIKATNDAVIAQTEAVHAKDEVKTLSVEVMEALAHTIDAKDEYTRGHSVRVAKYSRMIAERLNLSSEECENVYYMALLHDIGKIGVPNEIINSTTKLTDDEYAVIKTHPGVGYDILAEIKSRPDLSIGARWHHERYDGKGYPDGKKGEEIPFFARIIAVADSYDAMTSNRSYRKYMPQDKVRFEIENNIGSQFDPDVAKCMLSIIDEDVDYELHE